MGAPMEVSGEALVSTLACHLPAGTGTAQAPEWTTADVARFLAERLTEAGYRVVYDE